MHDRWNRHWGWEQSFDCFLHHHSIAFIISSFLSCFESLFSLSLWLISFVSSQDIFRKSAWWMIRFFVSTQRGRRRSFLRLTVIKFISSSSMKFQITLSLRKNFTWTSLAEVFLLSTLFSHQPIAFLYPHLREILMQLHTKKGAIRWYSDEIYSNFLISFPSLFKSKQQPLRCALEIELIFISLMSRSFSLTQKIVY